VGVLEEGEASTRLPPLYASTCTPLQTRTLRSSSLKDLNFAKSQLTDANVSCARHQQATATLAAALVKVRHRQKARKADQLVRCLCLVMGM
jgi:hypothetical protein